MNKMCEEPIRSATDMLKHMAAHTASRAFAPIERVTPEDPKTTPSGELTRASGVPASVDRFEPQSSNQVRCRRECTLAG